MRPFDEENWLSAKRATAACGRAGSPWPIDPAPCRARQCEARPRAAWISNLRRYLLPLLLMPKSLGFLQKPFADGGYQGPQFCKAQKKALPCLTTEIVKRSDAAKGFEVLPKRQVVERTFSWLGRCRRLAKDWENLNRKALAFLHLASIRLMLRKLCNQS